ncbi:MAG: M15 family metallopeptidase [Erysipelotrichaceae bacterium]|nr:M15 family metallopeptidase [Erysipelotrichaceae bacterium]
MNRIIPRILIILLLSGLLGGGVYYMFFMDQPLRDLGYTPAEIEKLRTYKITEKVTAYNPGLIYALQSEDFVPENMDYYISIISNSDVTKDINDLAKMYTMQEVKSLSETIKDEDLYNLVFQEKIKDINLYKRFYNKGYDYVTSVKLTNELNDQYAATLMEMPLMEYKETVAFMNYAKTGYSPQFIEFFYSNFDHQDFINLASIQYFSELEGLITADGFKINNLARYIWHMQNYQTSAAVAIANINDDYDVPGSVDYSAFYNGAEQITVTDKFTVLVNKKRQLPAEYLPSDLTEITGEFRDSNQPLVKEAREAFEKMAKAYTKDHETPIISYNGYISFADQNALYNSRLSQLNNNAAELDKILGKAGYDEHQTGLATNITEKGVFIYDFDETEACTWVKDNCQDYGFILRYPKDKEYLTGYRANSYHYRYVGEAAAQLIKLYGWCYEEYYYLFVEAY